jgi:hypothetical protein
LKKEDIRRWKDLPCSYITGLNNVKMAALPKLICRSNAIPIKIPMMFNPKIQIKTQKIPNIQSNP